MRMRLAVAMAAWSLPAWAHAGEPLAPHDVWTAWTFDVGTVAPLVVAAVLYARGARVSRGIRRRRQALFWLGWLVLAVALVSPIHALGESLFSAHMLQHEILMLVAAPMLAVSRPVVAFLWGVPQRWRRGLGQAVKARWFQALWRWFTRPLTAWFVHGAAIWVWHAPRLFQSTLTSEWMHALQHISFLGTALQFWWSLLPVRERAGIGLLSVFSTAVHTGILGALLTFSPVAWYGAYAESAPAFGLTVLEDQQIGGLIMWVPASVVYLIAGLVMLRAWLRPLAPVVAAVALLLMVGSGCHRATREEERGRALVAYYGCGSCHIIGGVVGARGMVGPPLTGVGSRTHIAGSLVNTQENVARWVEHPRAFHPDTAMPEMGVTPADAAAIAAYLRSLR